MEWATQNQARQRKEHEIYTAFVVAGIGSICDANRLPSSLEIFPLSVWSREFNYLLTYDSYVPLYNRFHRGEWITRVSGGEGALDTPGPLNGTSEAIRDLG